MLHKGNPPVAKAGPSPSVLGKRDGNKHIAVETQIMKLILPLISALSLLAITGCIYPGHRGGGEYHDHGEYQGHGEYQYHSEYRGPPEPQVNVRIHAE